MERVRSERTAKALAIIATAAILFRSASSAANHTVEGNSGWDLTSNLEAWTSETTFSVGDSLLFSYTPVHDVVEVGPEDYQSCVSSNPIATHNDGESLVPLTQPGTRYFICGRRGHCEMGLKLQVHVLAQDDQAGPDKNPGSTGAPPPSGSKSGPARSRRPHGCGPVDDFLCLVAAAVIVHVIVSLVTSGKLVLL